MISEEEYKFITDKISDAESAAKKAGSLCADLKKTINLADRSVAGSDFSLFLPKNSNQIDYFAQVESALQSVALDKFVESISETPTTWYTITADVDEVFIDTWPASVSADDVTITNFTSRPGDTLAENGTLSGSAIDALVIYQRNNVTVKNSSFYWSVDEAVSILESPGTIFEYNIIAESLNESYHPTNQFHGSGILINGPVAHSNYTPYIIRNNLFAHHYIRTPDFYSSFADPGDGKIRGQLRCTYANNISYNFGIQAVKFDSPAIYLDGAVMEVDFVGNIYIQGPDSDLDNVKKIIKQAHADNVYQKDNYIILSDGTVHDLFEWAGADNLNWKTEPNFNVDYESDYRVVLEDVLDNAGSRVRDYHDSRIISHVKNIEGEIIDSQTEVERPLQTGTNPNSNLSKLVIAIQEHILARYDTIDDFLGGS